MRGFVDLDLGMEGEEKWQQKGLQLGEGPAK
jgi:hypothetical protein